MRPHAQAMSSGERPGTHAGQPLYIRQSLCECVVRGYHLRSTMKSYTAHLASSTHIPCLTNMPSYTAQPLLAVDVEDVRVGVSAHKGPPAAM
jgi:hypothetical protein